MIHPTRRRRLAALLLPCLAALAACSVLPERPYQEVRRFALMPERPRRAPPAPRGPVLLVRTLRAAPGMDARGLRIQRPGGVVEVEFWNEWAAPPEELAEEALRRWLSASGLFSAVIAPGSRLRPDLILEGELIRLQAEPALGVARAGLSALLLRQAEGAAGNPTIRGQYVVEGTAPLPTGGGARPDGRIAPEEAAQGMAAALADALAALEAQLRATLARRG